MSVRWAAVIPLAQKFLPGSSILPGCQTARVTPPSLFGIAPCGVCQACPLLRQPVRSYRTISPLPRGTCRLRIFRLSIVGITRFTTKTLSGKLSLVNPQSKIRNLNRGGIFSVALSVLSRVPRVTGHTTLWSSDFPPAQPVRIEPATARPASRAL